MEVIEKLVFEVNIYIKPFLSFSTNFFPIYLFPSICPSPLKISQPYLPFLRKLMALRN